mgnify:CR=1 FL=1
MASVSSFRDVIANLYYNDLFDELSEYIERLDPLIPEIMLQVLEVL